MRKKEKARGSFPSLVEPEPSPTLLMSIAEPLHNSDRVSDAHQRAVENLENILSEEEGETEGSEGLMSESDDSD